MTFLSALKTKTPFDSRLTALYALNISDYIFTLILLSTGYFFEGNPMLSGSIGNFGGFVLKCILPFVLLFYIRIRLRNTPITKIKTVKCILNIGIIFYAIVNAMHLFGFVLLMFVC